MATTKLADSENLVTAYIQKLEPALAEIIETLRQIILSTDTAIGEQIKWNSPSFYYTGEMKPFDPKEYKRDIVVINIHKGYALLVFPTGAKVKDGLGLLEGDYKDGRRLAKFYNMEDVATKGASLKKVITAWLKLLDK
jgi:hypothetical protein